MTWFLLSLIPPFLWGMVNIVDRFVSSNDEHDISHSMIIVNAAKIPFLVGAGWWLYDRIAPTFGTETVLWWAVLWGVYCFAVLLYLMVLQKGEASVALPIYEIGPVWALLLGFGILNEYPTAYQIGCLAVMVVGSLILSIETDEEGKKRRIGRILWTVLVSSLFFNVSYVLFKYAHRTVSVESLFFFQYAFQAVFAIVGWFAYAWLKKRPLPKIPRKVWMVSTFGETAGMFGTYLIMFAYAAWPVALVNSVASTQSVYVLLFSYLLSKYFPNVFKEKWDRASAKQKLVGSWIILLGVTALGIGGTG